VTFKNIFDGGGSEAMSAEESARQVHEKIPGARPEREGVDPELYDGIPDAVRDPKIVRETSPEALSIMENFITPLFKNTQTVAAKQKEASENPESTSGMASSANNEAFKKVKVEIKEEDRPKIREEDRPKISDEQLEESRKDNRQSAKDIKRTDDGSTKG
jgi:gamma-glutamylcysteine synthetase